MKILLYNIDHGGKVGKNLKARWPKLIKTIKSIDADIVIILEAWGWSQNKEMKDFAKKSSFKYFSLSKSNTKHHIGLISNIKPKKIIKYKKDFWHSVLQANFEDFTIFGIHLNHNTESKRLLEAKRIIDFANKSNNPIILGDFNSLSPQDNYNNKRLLAQLNKKNIIKFGKEKLEKRVIKKFLDAGLIDIYKKQHSDKTIHYSVPTKICTDIDHLTKLRLDYAFVGKSIAKSVKKTSLIKNKLTNYSSDHFPLILEI